MKKVRPVFRRWWLHVLEECARAEYARYRAEGR
jgi:hypothetical protein